jgi:hypothetical protein
MAELTQLESKLAEVLGLAQAAQPLTEKVQRMVDDDSIAQTLQRLHDEAAETEQRCTEVAGELDGKKTAIEEKARETKSEAQEMAGAYLGDDADALDGFEFLIMAEAGELGHVEIAGTMAEKAGEQRVKEVLDWALPIQERHLADTRDAALALAKQEDPTEVA